MGVSLPHFTVDLRPTSDSFAFVVQVKWVVPDREVVNFISDLFVCLSRIFTTE